MGKRSREGSNEKEIDKKEKKRRRKEEKKLRKENKKKELGTSVADGHAQVHALSMVAPEKPVFFEKKLELSMALLPMDLKSPIKSIESSLRNSIFKYSDQMQGVLLSFSDIKILNNGHGRIINDLPHVHYTITCNVLVFQPVAGSILKGHVKECFPSHVSLTVYHYFNASIPASSLHEKGFSYEKDSGEWQANANTGASSAPNSHIVVGAHLQFEVASMHESGGIISIEGTRPSSL